MESVADWYSRNLSTETRKGKKERALQGYHNNRAPFGCEKDDNGILIPNDEELVGLIRAFELYDTGNYSDNKIARWLNDNGYRSKTGRRFSTDTVRDMLQNRTYLGFVKYQEYSRQRNGKRDFSAEVQWFDGKHEAMIDVDLFNRCQEIRSQKRTYSKYHPKFRIYLLRDLIFCADCVADMPENVKDDNYGKMRAHSQTKKAHTHLYYRCRASDFGRECGQTAIHADIAEAQVVEILSKLQPPQDWRERMAQSMGDLLGDKQRNYSGRDEGLSKKRVM